MSPDMSFGNLLYRRQFILGDRPVPGLQEWSSIQFSSVYLKAHPDLEITITRGSKAEFLLLGFALNHHRPEANNQDLMDEMAATCGNVGEMLEYCRDLCGRYVLIYNFMGKTTGLLSDLICSRSVYYCVYQNTVWCASQPGMLARHLDIAEDSSPLVRTYIEKDMFAYGEGCWIGEGTKYAGVKHLLPNHYLDFNEKRPVRYWPTSKLETVDVEFASRKSAEILQNTMLAATNRFPLSMAITAGWDSRTMLAATRNVRSKIYYYIQKFGSMTDRHPDIRIPHRLTQKVGIPFHIIECGDYHDEAFDTALERNVFVLHNPAKKVLFRSFYQNFQGKVNASGNISDLCRTTYGTGPVHGVQDLLTLVRLSGSEYGEESLKEWYAEAKTLCASLCLSLRDFFFWEQVLGNWGSMFAAELDIAIDEFYPFGTRRLVETILSVDENLRPYTNSKVHRGIIRLLWPELLTEPINPIDWCAQIINLARSQAKRVLARMKMLSDVTRSRLEIRDQ